MDAFLSEDALLFLKALGALPSDSRETGCLIGHIQGRRFIVEKVFPAGKSFTRSPARFHELNEIFGSRIIGFFQIRPDEKSRGGFLKPFAYGKLFLDVRFAGYRQMSVKPFVIDFRDDFYFSPIRLHRPSARRA